MFPNRFFPVHALNETEGELTLLNPSAAGNPDTVYWTVTQGSISALPQGKQAIGGEYCWWGDQNADASMYQRIDFADYPVLLAPAAVDAGTMNIEAMWWGGTWEQGTNDQPKLSFRFLDASLVEISTATNGYRDPTTVYATNFKWNEYTDQFDIPALTRYVDIVLDFNRRAGTNNDARVDDIRLRAFTD